MKNTVHMTMAAVGARILLTTPTPSHRMYTQQLQATERGIGLMPWVFVKLAVISNRQGTCDAAKPACSNASLI